MFNRSIKHSVIPVIWKCSRVIPLLKPGKPADQVKSYRPVSLLSPLIKLLETSMLPFVLESFSHAEHQHGSRKGHSTTTALCEIDDHIRTGLNRRKPAHRTFMVFLDIRAAFDTVNINKLIEMIEKLNLHVNIKRWLKNYLHGRQAKVEFRNSVSKGRTISSDVPQGGVLSPCLFNIYMATAPIPPEDEKLVSYADDCTVLSSGPIISEIETKTNSYLAVLLKWFEENSFELSPGKSSATLITTFSNESSRTLKIEVESNRIPTEKHPKLLGVTFEPMYRFGSHAKTVVDRVAKRNNVLCALARSSWVKDKELPLTTYKATGRAIINYAAPVWSPGQADSHWQKIQRCQNSALRSATGCTRMTMEDDLHNETKILPVRDHCQLLSAQHLLASQSTHHPNHGIKDSVSEREMRKTLTEEFGSDVESAPERSHPKWLKRGNIILHSKFVRKSVSKMPQKTTRF